MWILTQRVSRWVCVWISYSECVQSEEICQLWAVRTEVSLPIISENLESKVFGKIEFQKIIGKARDIPRISVLSHNVADCGAVGWKLGLKTER